MDTLELKSEHILEGQAALCAALAPFCRFDGYTLYFPRTLSSALPQFLAKERKVILPLFWQEQLLGVLVLQKVHGKREVRALLPRLPAIVDLILAKMALTRALQRDPSTGLLRESVLFARMAEEVDIVRAPDMATKDLSQVPAYRLCMGFLLIRLCNGDELSQRCGFAFLDTVVKQSAKLLQDHIPATTLLARTGQYAFALLFHATGREKCRALADRLLGVLRQQTFSNPLTRQSVFPIFAAGFVYYPYDMRGYELQLPLYEQARIVRKRAALACDVAAKDRVLAYAEILKRGGRIVEVLPLGRYRISLGRLMGVKARDRFAIFGIGSSHTYKGDVVVVQVRKKDAIVEVAYQERAGETPNLGDQLEYANVYKDDAAWGHESGIDVLSPTNFYAMLEERLPSCALFSLAMLHLEENDDLSVFNTMLSTWSSVFDAASAPLVGRHGPNTLVVFHPDVRPEELLDPYTRLASALLEKEIPCACGLAGYPLLSFHKSAIQECAVKALEYALLLPNPRVGICNSLTFTISADKRMSVGDLFGALEEYKSALALDENNDMAWNSMGVCMAGLGRREDARRHFLEALTRIQEPERRAQILYNLGTISQDLHDLDEASTYYTQCVEEDPKHVYAWIRLGQICEQQGKNDEAKKKYEQGAKIGGDSAEHASLVRRHLARVAIKEHRDDEARSLLQDALRQNPDDAAAMLMLARVYLDAGDNPALAEVLARRSVSLHDSPEGWEMLAQALTALGRDDEAHTAMAQAGR